MSRSKYVLNNLKFPIGLSLGTRLIPALDVVVPIPPLPTEGTPIDIYSEDICYVIGHVTWGLLRSWQKPGTCVG